MNLLGTKVYRGGVPKPFQERAHSSIIYRAEVNVPGDMGNARNDHEDMQQERISANDQQNNRNEHMRQNNNAHDDEEQHDDSIRSDDNSIQSEMEYNYNMEPNVRKSQRVFGEKMDQLEEDSLRLVSLNINNIGIHSYNNSKQDMLKNWLYDNEVSIIGMQELGVAMHLVPKHDRLHERMRDLRWKKIKVSQANNKNENVEKSQYGGTAVVAFDEAAMRATSKTGVDTTGLGRWAWMLFEGKQRHRTRIISAYNPCKSMGDETVYMQQKRYFLSKGKEVCPREQFIMDLTNQIKNWQRQNDQIVLMIDGNENFARLGPLHVALLRECRLIDPIRFAYQHDTDSLPATSSTGSVPIDAIFVSHQIKHITRGGWLKHGETVGDHRPLYIDIPILTLLGEPPFHIHRPEARRLTCDHPKVVKKFNELVQRQMDNEGTAQNFHILQQDIQRNQIQKEDIKIAADRIDRSCTNAINYAEKRCRNLNMGEVPWSVELSKAGRLIQLWNLVLRKKYGRNVSSTYIKRVAKKCQVQHPMQLSIEDCINERNLASKNYKSIKKDAKVHRKQFILKLAEDHAAEGNETIGNAVRRIIRTEEDRGSRRRIRIATKPYHGATEKVALVHPVTNETRITTDKEEIEQALQKENKKKFRLAYSSPFLQQPIIKDIKQHATNRSAQKILNGTFNPVYRISSKTKQFIKLLEIPESLKSKGRNSAVCDIQEAMQHWKKKREKTSSSMSNRHIGTYKAMTKNVQIFNIVHGISSLAYEHGFTLERWTYDLDVTLLKKPGKIKPDEFRTIGTLEADFNQGASLHFSKRMMASAIASGSIPASQYATKGKRSIEAAIVKTLCFDYFRLHKLDGAFIAMDLMQCFDRMAHPISSLATQRLGVPANVAHSMITTLCQMKHFIRTAYGDSEEWYSGTSSRPLQGGVQGNGAAAPIFIAISCVLLNYLEGLVTGMKIQTAISLAIMTITAVMYVDDADIIIAARDHNESLESIVQRTQNAASIWRRGIHQTGGALRPEKCKWYLIHFQWKNSEWYMKDSHNVQQFQLIIKDTNMQPIRVERLDNKIGLKGLGVHIAPDGSYNDQMQASIKKIQQWNESIRTSYLDRHDVHLSAFSSIFKTVEYVLPATSLNTRQCHKLDTTMHKTYISRIGINKNLPLPYRYASKRFQGLSSFHVESNQIIQKIKIFVTHANQNTQLGMTITSMLESIQLFLCTDTNFFELDYSKYGHLFKKEKGWIIHMWQVCSKYKIQLRGRHACPKVSRINDFSLMEKAVSSGRLTNIEIKHVQKCLLYFQVLHISDISKGDGSSIKQCYISHEIDNTQKSIYKWPKQTRPTSMMWYTWDKCINEIWTRNGSIYPMLGDYISASHMRSQWSFCEQNELLYDNSTTPVKVYQKLQTLTRSNNRYTFSHEVTTAPVTTKMAFVSVINRFRPILEICCDTITPQQLWQENINIEERLMSQHFFRHSQFSQNIHVVAQAILNHHALIVTDASVQTQTNTGAASWVLVDKNTNLGMSYGDHGVPKGNKTMDSYRGEVYGIFASLYAVSMVKEKFNIQTGTIEVACDNDASLLHSITYDTPARVTNGSFDILWAIHHIKKRLRPLKIVAVHVKGHQDRHTNNLSRVEKLNVLVDKRAEVFRDYIEKSEQYEYSDLHKYFRYGIYINGTHITSHIDDSLRNWIQMQPMRKFLNATHALPYTAFEEVDWDSVEKATTSLTNSRRIWLTKFASGFCGVATKMKACGYWDNDICPLCNLTTENTKHVLQCSHEDISDKYNAASKKMLEWMRKNDTAPTLTHLVEIILRARYSRTFQSCIPREMHGMDIHKLAVSQDDIGIHNFYLGRITQFWKKIQTHHYITNNSMRSANSWACRFILQIYLFTHSVWTKRCELVHEGDKERLSELEHEKLNQAIVEQYQMGAREVRECHRHMFDHDLEDIMSWEIKEKKFWLLTVTSSRDFITNQELNMYDGMREIMRRWQRPIT